MQRENIQCLLFKKDWNEVSLSNSTCRIRIKANFSKAIFTTILNHFTWKISDSKTAYIIASNFVNGTSYHPPCRCAIHLRVSCEPMRAAHFDWNRRLIELGFQIYYVRESTAHLEMGFAYSRRQAGQSDVECARTTLLMMYVRAFGRR